MFNQIRKLYRKIYIGRLVRNGLIVGKGLQIESGVKIDANFPWLIEIGDNVILAPKVYILSHDAAAQNHIRCTKIGKTHIGSNVFIGAMSIILPGVSIGDNTIIGAGSVVAGDVPPDTVYAGNPAKQIMGIHEYVRKHADRRKKLHNYNRAYTLWGGISGSMKECMLREMGRDGAYITIGE